MPALTVPQAFDLAFHHHQAGRLAEAEALYRQILAVAPRHADALHLLGVLAAQNGRHELAVKTLLQAIALAPKAPLFHSNLGETYRRQGRLEEAIAAYRQAIQFQPDDPEGYNNIGIACTYLGRRDEAMAAFRQAIALRPGYAHAHNNLGAALMEEDRRTEAMASYRQAIELSPDYAEAHNNLGVALLDQGRLDEAIAAYRRAMALNPSYLEASSSLLMGLHYLPGMNVRDIFEEHERWGARVGPPLAAFIPPHPNDRDPERRLRIGYVSPDYRGHAVAYFVENLLAAHDREAVETYCYADHARDDEVSDRLRQSAGEWRKIMGLSDAQVADLIRRDGIDILVDLAGHTARNRLLVFARKPAPVQVTWLGYPNTTGLSAMDYRLTDAHADPPGTTEHLHTEALVRLPDTAWCFRPSAHSPEVPLPPVLRAGHITFGCFNARPKMNVALLELWARVLLAVPDSRLLLKVRSLGDPTVRKQTRDCLEKFGITPDRVDLQGHSPTSTEHLAAYGRLDIALDTFPYCGTTTTCEALWMGVPVVTMAGHAHVSRVGVSLLTNVGLPELIAGNPDEYVRVAVQLANDIPRLSALRSSLRQQMAASPLMDSSRFARHVEAAYREMWRRWCGNR